MINKNITAIRSSSKTLVEDKEIKKEVKALLYIEFICKFLVQIFVLGIVLGKNALPQNFRDFLTENQNEWLIYVAFGL